MQPYSKDPINYLRNKFDKWRYIHSISSKRQKRYLLISVLSLCIVLLLLLPGFSPEMEQRKPIIYLILIIASANLFFLLYQNFTDIEALVPPPQRPAYSSFIHKGSSPFNPTVEESSKRLIRETSEQLESSSKILAKKPISFYDSVTNPKDGSTRRRLDFHKHNETAPFSGFGSFAAYAPNPNLSASGVFPSQPYVQTQPTVRSSSVSRSVKDFQPPSSFGEFRQPVSRQNYHLADGGPRRGEYGLSSSPIRSGPGVPGSYGRNSNYFSSKALNDEQFLPSARDYSQKNIIETEADELLRRLNISSEFHGWNKNCQRWFSAKLIPKILEANIQNTKELNRIIGYFDKRLYEYEYILKLDQGRTTDNIPQKSNFSIITIDELLAYESAFQTGGSIWPSSQLAMAEINRAHYDMRLLVQERRKLEKSFEIDGFKPFEVRTYILERLFKIRENLASNFRYNVEKIRRKLPSDTQILANLFFCFLNTEAVSQTDERDQIYRNFVFKSNTNTMPSNISNEDVYFRQTVSETFEPHYDIVSGKELWTAYPGMENLFYAIVLFVWHIKTKKHGTLGFEESRAFKEFMQMVIP